MFGADPPKRITGFDISQDHASKNGCKRLITGRLTPSQFGKLLRILYLWKHEECYLRRTVGGVVAADPFEVIATPVALAAVNLTLSGCYSLRPSGKGRPLDTKTGFPPPGFTFIPFCGR